MSIAINMDALMARLSSIKKELSPTEKFFRETMPAEIIGCEIREPQIDMALAIEKAIKERKHVISEAGTGTGKSLAYLVPVIEHIRANGGRAVISTGTIALQEQLINKDIPFLQETLWSELDARLAKGKGNYLCLFRLEEETKQTYLWMVDDNLSEWAETTETGDRAELAAEPGEIWGKICVDDSCTGKKCPKFGECFYLKAKARLQDADIVVCNHALFCIDMAIRAATEEEVSILPEFQIVVFDEAHHLENIAREALSTQVSSLRLPLLLAQLRKRPGCDYQAVQDAIASNDIFFQAVVDSGAGDKFLLPESRDISLYRKELTAAVRGIIETFDDNFIGDVEEKLFDRLNKFNAELRNVTSRGSFNGENLSDIAEWENPGGENETVYWVEIVKGNNGRLRVTLHATPIDVSKKLNQLLFTKTDTIVMTSATLAAGSNFNYLKQSIGCTDAVELLVDSPFNYPNQFLLYLPPNLPDPKAADFHERVTPVIEEILLKTNGRAFVLFTSYKGMNEVHDRLAGRLKWTVLKQGAMPKQRILEAFQNDINSVLFATASFWEGVSIEGEALSCVVIVKLPFAVPDDPITEAKVKAIERAGGKAFFDYSMPEAIIKLKQGFGRLIRTRQDKGIVAILDPRVKTKGYGRRFLNSLPRCREISSLENVDLFLNS